MDHLEWKFAGHALEDYNINGVTVKHNRVWISTETGLLFFDNADNVLLNYTSKVFFKK